MREKSSEVKEYKERSDYVIRERRVKRDERRWHNRACVYIQHPMPSLNQSLNSGIGSATPIAFWVEGVPEAKTLNTVRAY